MTELKNKKMDFREFVEAVVDYLLQDSSKEEIYNISDEFADTDVVYNFREVEEVAEKISKVISRKIKENHDIQLDIPPKPKNGVAIIYNDSGVFEKVKYKYSESNMEDEIKGKIKEVCPSLKRIVLFGPLSTIKKAAKKIVTEFINLGENADMTQIEDIQFWAKFI